MTSLVDIKQQLVDSNRTQEDTTVEVMGLHESFNKYFDWQKDSWGKQLEAQIDASTGSGPGLPGQPTGSSAADLNNDMSFKALGILGIALAGLTATVSASVGAFKGYVEVLKASVQTLKNIFSIEGSAGRLTQIIDDFVFNVRFNMLLAQEKIVNGFKSFGNLLRFADDSPAAKAVESIKAGFASVRTYAGAIAARFQPIANIFSDALETLKGLLGGSRASFGFLRPILAIMNPIATMFKSIGGVVGKLFAPVFVIMTAYDTIKGAVDGFAQDGILGGIKGAIDGLFTSLITKPLDLLKQGVAWVIDRLGFDSSFLRSFSFTELWTSLTGKIFDGVSSAFAVVTDLFAWGEEDKTALGVMGKLTDIIYAPINMAINFISSMFGWTDPGETFKLQDWISEKFSQIVDSIKEKLSFIGSAISDTWSGITEVASEMWESLKGTLTETTEPIRNVIGFVGDNFTLMKDLIAADFQYQITKITNGMKSAFATLGTFVSNIPDQLYLLLNEYIRFTMPKMAIPIPRLLGGGEMVLTEGFDVGFGDTAGASDARSSIENREAALAERLSDLESETSSRLADANAIRDELAANMQAMMVSNDSSNNSRSVVQIQQGDVYNGEPVPSAYNRRSSHMHDEAIGIGIR